MRTITNMREIGVIGLLNIRFLEYTLYCNSRTSARTSDRIPERSEYGNLMTQHHRKAIGWMLREVSKNRSEPVNEYVRRYEPVISGVTFREAVKYLVESECSELRTACKNR